MAYSITFCTVPFQDYPLQSSLFVKLTWHDDLAACRGLFILYLYINDGTVLSSYVYTYESIIKVQPFKKKSSFLGKDKIIKSLQQF